MPTYTALLATAVLSLSACQPLDGDVNINTATQSQLQQLCGVDASLASRIIANRPYTSPRNLINRLDLPMIWDAQNGDRLSISGPTTLRTHLRCPTDCGIIGDTSTCDVSPD